MPFKKAQQIIKEGEEQNEWIIFPLESQHLVAHLAQITDQDQNQENQETEQKAGD